MLLANDRLHKRWAVKVDVVSLIPEMISLGIQESWKHLRPRVGIRGVMYCRDCNLNNNIDDVGSFTAFDGGRIIVFDGMVARAGAPAPPLA
jgi:hypothetical protein